MTSACSKAPAFLERHGLLEEQVMTVWKSIALDTTSQVPFDR